MSGPNHNQADRHQRNGHTMELDGAMWRCLQCRHIFDAAVDAERFFCGDECSHPMPSLRVVSS